MELAESRSVAQASLQVSGRAIWLGERPGNTRAVDADDYDGETLEALVKARSMLLILLATCETTLLALDAAANVLDIDMAQDLRRMIARTQDELAVMDKKLAFLGD